MLGRATKSSYLIMLLVTVFGTAFAAFATVAQDLQNTNPLDKVGADVFQQISSAGNAKVFVALKPSSDDVSLVSKADVLAKRHDQVKATRLGVLADSAQYDFTEKTILKNVPALIGTVTSAAGVRALAKDPRVARIDLDPGGSAHLASSVPSIGANLRHQQLNNGEGVVVAVIDSGVDSDHPNLQDSLVHEACFLDNDGQVDGVGLCPNGSDRQFGTGAAEDDRGHGTHVTGIITYSSTGTLTGVAPEADIVSIKALDSNGRFQYASEIVAAMDYVLSNPELNVQVVNLSLGTDSLFSGDCDDSRSYSMAAASVVNSLRAAGVVTVASAGNASSTGQMGFPACLRNVISVGASNDDGFPASFTNSSPTTDMFGPGVNVSSSWLGGGLRSSNGTSMAAPHVAGCAALLMQTGDFESVDEVETWLEDSDKSVVVPASGLAYPQLDCGYRPNQSPIASFVTTQQPNDTIVNFDAEASNDPDGTLVSYDWQFGDGAIGSGPTISHSYDVPGEYLVTLTVADDEDAVNSVSRTITVSPPGSPNLSVSDPTLDNSFLVSGERFIGSVEVVNSGTSEASTSRVRFFLSTDEAVTTTDQPLGTDTTPVLSAGASSRHWVPVQAPELAGEYYFGACVEAVAGEVELSDQCSSGALVEVTSQEPPPEEPEPPEPEPPEPPVPPIETQGLMIEGFVWRDGNADALRDDDEAGEADRTITLFRCFEPWGIAGTTLSAVPLGAWSFKNLEPGEYQIGTPTTDVEFSPLMNDNLVYPNGFSNCVRADENPTQIGVGILPAETDRVSLTGFSWLDENADGVRDSDEAPDVGREVVAYRCKAPWGIAGRATTNADGLFELVDALPGDYQFGVVANDLSFAPLAADNDMYPNGFTNCIGFGETSQPVGIGVLP